MLEHPSITRALQTGYPNGEPEAPTCPCCGRECETIYLDDNRYALGCNNCIKAVDAWDYQQGVNEYGEE